jgi:hypothetical protein
VRKSSTFSYLFTHQDIEGSQKKEKKKKKSLPLPLFCCFRFYRKTGEVKRALCTFFLHGLVTKKKKPEIVPSSLPLYLSVQPLSPFFLHGQQAANHFSSLFLSVSVKPK